MTWSSVVRRSWWRCSKWTVSPAENFASISTTSPTSALTSLPVRCRPLSFWTTFTEWRHSVMSSTAYSASRTTAGLSRWDFRILLCLRLFIFNVIYFQQRMISYVRKNKCLLEHFPLKKIGVQCKWWKRTVNGKTKKMHLNKETTRQFTIIQNH